ncbi:mitochondrial 54S ribosomal protein mL53 [Limtongia smithiae]|uniref:mitochondrial 54S ribosomal protein mL53 n=1 Tax=Limtongia smithiae TaxID=1125753 RepID=UPI0034CF0B6E
MITKYITAAVVRFDPFQKGKAGRIFLSLIPQSARNSIKLTTEVLTPNSAKGPIISVTFRDGRQVDVDPTKTSITDLVDELDRHSRHLLLEEQMRG